MPIHLTNRWRRALRLVGGAFVLLLLAAAFTACWYFYRPPPPETTRSLHPAITYECRHLDGPVVVHLIWLDLTSPELSFLVTPPNPIDDYPLRGQRTSEFARQHDLFAAINGDFFEPWHSDAPWDYYPHEGDGVRPFGTTASSGNQYATGDNAEATLFIATDNRASFGEPPGPIHHAISGRQRLLRNGRANLTAAERAQTDPHPRTVVGLDATGTRMGWLVADGRQPNYSIGLTLAELETLLLAENFADAVNFDGGGSTTMAARDGKGRIRLLNTPINHRIPGHERHVANHLGVRISQPAPGS